jgi:hypothetical protein
MDKHEALDWFLRRKSMYLDEKCQAAEDIALEEQQCTSTDTGP